jgi:hypothetical protein
MDQKQFDAMLSDGETRLTRLKMLYEQWFLGFERLEPAILRKEFEDMLAMLRREQVGNTALRFRLQQLVQRHMTFATHWRRVARQIEDGTYQRDVLRARRLREQNIERDNAGPELELSYDVDLDDELAAALDEVHRAAERAAAKPSAAVAPLAAQQQPGRPLAGAWASAASDTPAAAGSGAASLPLAPAASVSRNGPQRAISPFAMPAAAGAQAPVAAPAPATNLLGAIAAANGNGAKAANPAARTAAAAGSGAAQKPKLAAQPAAANDATTTPKAAGASTAGNAAVAKLAAAATSNGAAATAKPAVVAVAPNGAAANGAVATRPAATNAASPKASPAAASGSAAFSNDDMQRIYKQYLSARKQNAERVDNVKLDSIEKTLRGMLPQLEKKHAGKKIDFEVVVKDGKVALKPVAR